MKMDTLSTNKLANNIELAVFRSELKDLKETMAEEDKTRERERKYLNNNLHQFYRSVIMHINLK